MDSLSFTPEIFLVLCVLLFVLIGPFIKNKSYIIITYLSLFSVIIAQFFVFKNIFHYEEIFNNFFVIDSFSSFIKSLLLIGSGIILYVFLTTNNNKNINRIEFPILLVLSLIGMMLMVSSNDILSLFISMELQSLALYILVSFERDDINSSEAGVKYFVLGSLSTCIFLFGASLIYGCFGTTNFSEISNLISQFNQIPLILTIGVVFILVSLSLKISAAPFHMWTPDVYQGSPTIITAYLSVVPKIAAFAVIIRFLVFPFGEITIDWGKIILILSITSMIVGSLGALQQTEIKRLLAYSTINHVGFMLIGLVPGTEDGIIAICIYLMLYLLMNLGVFIIILNLKRDNVNVTSLKDLSGYFNNNQFMTFCMAVFMFSMAGIPPLSGFLGKLIVLNVAIDNNLIFLAIVGVLSSVIAAFYYLRIIKLMFFDPPIEEMDSKVGFDTKILLSVLAFLNVTILFYPKFFLDLSASITFSLFSVN
ncbi:MAG: NADH-quinone oxidoreductase subunit NuoN [Rickettsiales bacterium]|nr:NADH-quinone oxidoreductase subunit NuoN [Rickettsiales bacterium]|tara:strand:- start:262 stop:1698 length:1437 start_codon:yes stop_codon:yes gene_type:complete